jgi:hypothetical protein
VVSRSLRSALAAVGVGVVMVLLAPTSATAAPGDGSYPGGTPGGTQAGTNAPVTAQVRTCSLYAGNGSYGMTCRGAVSASATYAEILGGDPVPTCWDEPVPEDFVPPRYEPDQLDEDGRPLPGRWWLNTCLVSGLTRPGAQPDGPMKFSQEPRYILAPDGPVVLTTNQELVLAGQRNVRSIPEPFAATSPSETPRVGQLVAFYVPPSNTEGETITVSGPGIGTVSMRARMTELVVYPTGGRPDPQVVCPGGGISVAVGEDRESTPDACWWRWTRSSAHRSRGVYPVQVVARWLVEYDAGEGAGWTPLGDFTREQQVDQPVTEVQTVVVP